MRKNNNTGSHAHNPYDAYEPASGMQGPGNHPYGQQYPAGVTVQYVVQQPKDHTKRNIFIAILCVLLVVAIGVGVWWFGAGGDDFFDDQAQGGQAPYKTTEEIKAELNRIVEEGMLNISIASVIQFENGTSPGTAYIENVPNNKYVMRVTITLDSNGEVVYQSGGIKPDSFIETISLSQDLAAGTYPATATFVAYNPETLEEVGQAAAKVTIVVDS